MSKKNSAPKSKKAASKKSPVAKTASGKSAAKRPDAGKGDRLRREALAEIAGRLGGGKQEHEVPSAKELANTPRPAATSKGKRTKPETPAKRAVGAKRPSGLDLAAKLLADSTGPLNAKAIADGVIAAGWVTNGKTPDATLYAAMLREITTKGAASRFKRVDRGLFAAA